MAPCVGGPAPREARDVPVPGDDVTEPQLGHLYFTNPPTALQLDRFYAELAQKLAQLDGDLATLTGRVVSVETTTTRQAEVAAQILQRHEAAGAAHAGYLIELCRRVDNVFVFILVFA